MTNHDPGGKVSLQLQPGVKGYAEFTGENNEHRICLWREWGDGNIMDDYALIIGMNPSTARADIDDPTVRKDIGFCRRLGLTALCKGNIASFRATDPRRLAAYHEPNHPHNHPELVKLAKKARYTIFAHGILPKHLRPLCVELKSRMMDAGVKLHCFGYTKDGWPKHTLYLRGDTELQEYA